jgi:hypothetical protein
MADQPYPSSEFQEPSFDDASQTSLENGDDLQPSAPPEATPEIPDFTGKSREQLLQEATRLREKLENIGRDYGESKKHALEQSSSTAVR